MGKKKPNSKRRQEETKVPPSMRDWLSAAMEDYKKTEPRDQSIKESKEMKALHFCFSWDERLWGILDQNFWSSIIIQTN